jgi:hypothetical protein
MLRLSRHPAARSSPFDHLEILPAFVAIVTAFGSILNRSCRLRDATDRGSLVNLETRRGRPARIVVDDPMLEMVKLLPEPGELAA